MCSSYLLLLKSEWCIINLYVMVKNVIWLDIALLCCIFTRLRLVKIWPLTCAISSHITFSPIKLYFPATYRCGGIWGWCVQNGCFLSLLGGRVQLKRWDGMIARVFLNMHIKNMFCKQQTCKLHLSSKFSQCCMQMCPEEDYRTS